MGNISIFFIFDISWHQHSSQPDEGTSSTNTATCGQRWVKVVCKCECSTLQLDLLDAWCSWSWSNFRSRTFHYWHAQKKTYMMSPATSMEKIQAVHICISVIYNDHGVWIERYDTYNNDKLWINLIWSPPTWLNERHVKTMSIPKVQHLSLEGLERSPMPSRPRQILRKGDTKPRGQHTFRITKVFKFSLALLGLERLKNILARLRWHLLAGIMWASYS